MVCGIAPFSNYAIIANLYQNDPDLSTQDPAHNRLLPTTKLLIKSHDLSVAASSLSIADEAAVVVGSIAVSSSPRLEQLRHRGT